MEEPHSPQHSLDVVRQFILKRAGSQPTSPVAASSSDSAGGLLTGCGGVEVLVASVCGSLSYNLSISSSDVDYFGVFACGLEQLFRMKGPTMTLDTHEPEDICCYELTHYCQLLLKGNPKLVEPVFLDHGPIFRHALWERLRDAAGPAVLNGTVLQQYLSFAFSQLGDRAKKGGAASKNSKRLYHALRLASEAQRIASGLPPRVYLEGHIRDRILRVRLGEDDQDEAEQEVRLLLKELDRQPHQLPDAGALVAFLDAWALEVRRHQLSACQIPPTLKGELLNVESRTGDVEELDSLGAALERAHPDIEVAAILAVCLSGSALHGLVGLPEWPSRDRSADRLVIFLESGPSFLRTRKATPPTASMVTERPGTQFLEVGLFCSLLASGNHRAFEALEQVPLFACRAWTQLQQRSAALYSRSLHSHLLGVSSKLSASRPSERDHLLAIRLAMQARYLAAHGRVLDPSIPEQMAPLLASHAGDLSSFRTAMCAQIGKESSSLAKTSDSRVLDAWLIPLRLVSF